MNRFISSTGFAFFIGLSLFGTFSARADIFAVTDLKSFEACLLTDHLLESTKTGGGKQERLLGQPEIQQRCVQAAMKTIKGKSSADAIEFVKMVKRNSAHEQALPLIEVLAAKDPKACNDSDVYGVLKKALEHPRDFPTPQTSYFESTKRIVKLCVKDADFKKDFTEEKDSGDAYVGPNACAILLAEKLVASCPKK